MDSDPMQDNRIEKNKNNSELCHLIEVVWL